jgi:MATE family multidrug resistance protein
LRKESRVTLKQHLEGPGGIREMVIIALPMMISSGCETAMTFTDRLFLSRLGPELMAAALGGGLSVFVMTTFFIGLTGYTTALVAQYLGSSQNRFCALTATQAILICLLAYPLLLLARPLAHLFFRTAGLPPEQLLPQIDYFNILLYGTLFALLRNAMASYFSGLGRTRIVLLGTFVSMIANIGANYVLIFGKLGLPAMGIHGAAYGTLFSGALGVGVIGCFYFGPRNIREFQVLRAFRLNWPLMKKLIRFGSPAGIELFLNLLAFNTLIFLFQSHSLITSTAVSVVFSWDMVSFLPLLGVHIGVISLTGRYMGARQPELAHRATLSGLKMAWSYSFCILLIFLLLPNTLVEVFLSRQADLIHDPEARELSVSMLRLAALYVMADATFLVFGGALRGAGDTFWAMKASVLFHWLLVATLFLLLKVLGVSPLWSWLALCLTFIVFSLVFYQRYRAGKWRDIRLIDPTASPH